MGRDFLQFGDGAAEIGTAQTGGKLPSTGLVALLVTSVDAVPKDCRSLWMLGQVGLPGINTVNSCFLF